MRDNTERPETLEVGSNVLAGTNAESILSKTKEILNRENKWRNPFGDGKAGERIIKILMDLTGNEVCIEGKGKVTTC